MPSERRRTHPDAADRAAAIDSRRRDVARRRKPSRLSTVISSLSSTIAVAALTLLAPAAPGQQGSASPRPRLLVLCSVDQLATWVLQRGLPHMGESGFRRVLREGVEFTQCAYQHGCTETGPGHATLGTGAPARIHGIVKNEWHDPRTGAHVYCAAQPGVDALPDYPEGRDRGPGRLLVPTLGDSLKAHLGRQAKVVSVAWKDRSAILMAGQSADAVAWFEVSTGRLVTNTRWGPSAPAWVVAFNRDKKLDAFFGWTWDRIAPASAYADLVDDRPFEQPQPAAVKTHTLPVRIDGAGASGPGTAFWTHAFYSPVSNEATLLAAEGALEAEGLGFDDVPDLLCLSFSGNDTIGHVFGADSVEARDALLRVDALLARLFARLDERVGVGRWMVALSADHGVSPTPEVAMLARVAAGRGPLQARAKAAAETALTAQYGARTGKVTFVKMVAEMGLFFDRDVFQKLAGKEPLAPLLEQAAAIAAEAVRNAPGMYTAFSVPQLLRDGPGDDPIRRAMFFGLHPERAGDVLMVIEPFRLEGATTASHGSPWPYDREVPLLAMGGGLRVGVRCAASVTPGLGVVLMARALGLPRPPAAVEDVPGGVFVGQ